MARCDLVLSCDSLLFFFFNDTATTEIYTLSLHDALPISIQGMKHGIAALQDAIRSPTVLERPELAVSFEELNALVGFAELQRSEEHTSELQSQSNIVCRLLLEKKKKKSIARPVQIGLTWC